MTKTLAISFDGFSSTKSAMKTATDAVKAGIKNLWMAEHLGYREAFVTSMGFRMNDPDAIVIPTAVSPYLWHPTPTAMALASVAEVGTAPVGIAVATGNPLFLEQSGKKVIKPITAVREFVETLESLWAGQPVNYNGHFFQLSGAHLAFKPPQPLIIYIAAIGPQMLALAGRAADGIVLSAGLSPTSCLNSFKIVSEAAVAVNKNPDDIKKAAYVIFAVSEDSKTAISIARSKLAFLFRNKALAKNIEDTGLPVDQEKIIDAISRRDITSAQKYISDDAVEAFTISGTAKDCSNRIEQFYANRVDELVLMVQGDGQDQTETLNFLRDF